MRKFLIVFLVILLVFFNLAYKVVQGPIEAKVAVSQLEDSAVTYSTSRAIASGGIRNIVNVMLITALAIVCLHKKRRKET